MRKVDYGEKKRKKKIISFIVVTASQPLKCRPTGMLNTNANNTLRLPPTPVPQFNFSEMVWMN